MCAEQRRWPATDSDDVAGRLGPAQRRLLAQLVEERWHAQLTPGDLARACGLSAARLPSRLRLLAPSAAG